jgi:hypothetical protein
LCYVEDAIEKFRWQRTEKKYKKPFGPNIEKRTPHDDDISHPSKNDVRSFKTEEHLMKTIKLLTVACLLSCAAPAFAKIPVDVTAPTSAKPGQEVEVTVKTKAKADLKIEAQDAGVTQMLNLRDQKADANGKATWKFKIPDTYKADKMPVIVTVSMKGEKAQDKCVKEIEIKK